ncbi:hypothetical protein [Amycolatopsis nigrescens]|uniref:hypothetical protein n=1 Tax=Amycolatopsis nigrescens TaxID=381445 RepID=UPI00036AC383|nr:hypothetical protein [Amycolatopsis nigrescens]
MAESSAEGAGNAPSGGGGGGNAPANSGGSDQQAAADSGSGKPAENGGSKGEPTANNGGTENGGTDKGSTDKGSTEKEKADKDATGQPNAGDQQHTSAESQVQGNPSAEKPSTGQDGRDKVGEKVGDDGYEQRVLAEEPMPTADTGAMRDAGGELNKGADGARQLADGAIGARNATDADWRDPAAQTFSADLTAKADETRRIGEDMDRRASDLVRTADITDGLKQERADDLKQDGHIYEMAGTLPPDEGGLVRDRMVSDAVNRGRQATERAIQDIRDGFSDVVDGAKDGAGKVLDGAGEIGRDLWDGAKQFGRDTLDRAQQVGRDVSDGVARATDEAGKAWEGVQDTTRQATDKLGEAVRELGAPGPYVVDKSESDLPKQGKLGEQKVITGNHRKDEWNGTLGPFDAKTEEEHLVGTENTYFGSATNGGLSHTTETFKGMKDSYYGRLDHGLYGFEGKYEQATGAKVGAGLTATPGKLGGSVGGFEGTSYSGRVAGDIGGIGVGLTGEFREGFGLDADFEAGIGEDGKFHLRAKPGFSLGLGASAGVDLQVDTEKITETARKAADSVGSGWNAFKDRMMRGPGEW